MIASGVRAIRDELDSLHQLVTHWRVALLDGREAKWQSQCGAEVPRPGPRKQGLNGQPYEPLVKPSTGECVITGPGRMIAYSTLVDVEMTFYTLSQKPGD